MMITTICRANDDLASLIRVVCAASCPSREEKKEALG